ncbi:MAG: MarR family transcriptional regulator [Clostridiales bacterium]|jgi:DNA-binding MarR family transcriptional regulator|nr:MarR family transcriptional regulator [Clostridiales bacterium]
MKNELHNKLLRALFQLKKLTLTFRPVAVSEEEEMSLASYSLLYQIKARRGHLSGETIRQELSATKPAVSQMLAALGKKGFITLEVDKENRRCIVLSLIEKGTAFIERTEWETERRISQIISRFGENQARELIKLIDVFSSIANENG